MENSTYIVIKIGGRPAGNIQWIRVLLTGMISLQKSYKPVLVHGGGDEVSQLSKRLGLEPVFLDGIRMTTSEEMTVVDQILAGVMNTRILRQARMTGMRAVGLSGVDGGLFTAAPLDPKNPGNRTGRVSQVDPQVIHDLCAQGYVPILSSVADDGQGEGLNINADEAALVLSQALQARSLVYISDIPGVMKNKQVLPRLTPEEIEQEILNQTIQGGMIPKVRSCASALKHGVTQVVIGQMTKAEDLQALINGHLGTVIANKSYPARSTPRRQHGYKEESPISQ